MNEQDKIEAREDELQDAALRAWTAAYKVFHATLKAEANKAGATKGERAFMRDLLRDLLHDGSLRLL